MDDETIINTLDRKRHIEKLVAGLVTKLPKNFERLISSQTWLVYWITHSLSLLEQQRFLSDITKDVITFNSECWHKDGGYGGGPGQVAHLGTSFAAVSSLIVLDDEEALDSIDRPGLVRFLHRMKQLDGSFAMQDDGEIDSRATYCALAILRSLNINDPILIHNSADWILSCQTYEGGFGSVPGSEAHGGYTFCCVASLCLLGQLQRANFPALLRWLTNRQMSDDGGFCGRANKFVDSCYSYWQGAVYCMIHPFLTDSQTDILDRWLFNSSALQDYILNQCQAKGGLLRDKPGVDPDFYHTCYALSGLSLSQHQPDGSVFDIGTLPINLVRAINPIFNLTLQSISYCLNYFENKPIQILEREQEEEEEEEDSKFNKT